MRSKAFAALTVLTKDKSGIIARLSKELYDLKCNLEDVSMTVLEGELAMILIVGFKSLTQRDEVILSAKDFEENLNVDLHWKPLGAHALKKGEQHKKNSETYIISVIGRDRTGIVYHVSDLLAKEKININDLNSRILSAGKQDLYAMMLEVDLTRSKEKVAKLRQKLNRLAKKIKTEISLKPVERLTF